MSFVMINPKWINRHVGELAAPITELPAMSFPVGCLRLLWHPLNMKLEAVLGSLRGQPSGRVHYLMLHMPRRLRASPFTSLRCCRPLTHARNAKERSVEAWFGSLRSCTTEFFFLSALNSSNFRTGTEPSWFWAIHSHLSSPPSQTGFCLAWRKTMLLYQFTCFCEHVTI